MQKPPYRHVLALIDLDQGAQEVIAVSKEIVSQWGAEVSLLCVLPEVEQFLSGSDMKRAFGINASMSGEARDQINQLCAAENFEADVTVRLGKAHRVVTQLVKEEAIDLLVLSTSPESGAAGLIGAIVKETTLDVLCTDTKWLTSKQVVAAVDNDALAGHVLAQAANCAVDDLPAAVVSVNDAIKVSYLDEIEKLMPSARLANMLVELDNIQLDDIRARIAQLQIRVGEPIIVRGQAVRELRQYLLNTDAGLLVVGAGHRTRATGVLGATARQLIHEPQFAVLIVNDAAR